MIAIIPVNKICTTNNPRAMLLDLLAKITPRMETASNELKNTIKVIQPSIM